MSSAYDHEHFWLILDVENNTCKLGDTVNVRLSILADSKSFDEFENVDIVGYLWMDVPSDVYYSGTWHFSRPLRGFPITINKENFQPDYEDWVACEFVLTLDVDPSQSLSSEVTVGLVELRATASSMKGDAIMIWAQESAYVAIDMGVR